MNIITGYRGEPHITSAQDRAGNQGSYGTASYVLNAGSKLAASVISANEIHIADGILSHQGCLAIIETGTYDSVSINNGAQGMNRIDRIVARYTKDSDTNVESLELAVIQGTATASTPVAPDYNHGTIANGSTPVDMPLYQVRLTGITVSSVTAEFATVRTQKEMDTLLGNTSISGIGGGTVTGAISTLNSKTSFYSLGSNAGRDSVTTTATNHTLYNSRKFSDYQLLFATVEDTYARATIIIPQSAFANGTHIDLSWVDSANVQRWVDLKWVSDTSYSVQGSSGADGKYVRLCGLLMN